MEARQRARVLRLEIGAPEIDGGLRARIAVSIEPLEGWGTVEKGARLAELIIETEADRSVEIGVFGGRSTIPMAIAHQMLGRGWVTGIDPWEAAASLEGQNSPENDDWWAKIDYEAIYEQFVEALVQHKLLRQCRIMRERSDTAVRLFPDTSVSVLHQDGNHSEEVSRAEVEMWTPKLRSGGYWVADDIDWPTTERAQATLIAQGFAVVDDHGTWRVYQKP